MPIHLYCLSKSIGKSAFIVNLKMKDDLFRSVVSGNWIESNSFRFVYLYNLLCRYVYLRRRQCLGVIFLMCTVCVFLRGDALQEGCVTRNVFISNGFVNKRHWPIYKYTSFDDIEHAAIEWTFQTEQKSVSSAKNWCQPTASIHNTHIVYARQIVMVKNHRKKSNASSYRRLSLRRQSIL